ncbi:hypothetical protein D3C78_1003610 [compost metagenome]
MVGRHALECLAGTEEAAGDIDRQDALQAAGIHVLHAHLCFEYSGVVDQYIDATERLVQLAEHTQHVFFAGDIGCNRQGATSATFNLLHECFGGAALAVIVDADGIAALGGQQCGGCANAAAGAGDQHDLVHQGFLLADERQG